MNADFQALAVSSDIKREDLLFFDFHYKLALKYPDLFTESVG